MRLGTLRHILADVGDDAEVYVNLSPEELHRPDVKVTAVHIGNVYHLDLGNDQVTDTVVTLS